MAFTTMDTKECPKGKKGILRQPLFFIAAFYPFSGYQEDIFGMFCLDLDLGSNFERVLTSIH
jgi:hypothetical protein